MVTRIYAYNKKIPVEISTTRVRWVGKKENIQTASSVVISIGSGLMEGALECCEMKITWRICDESIS